MSSLYTKPHSKLPNSEQLDRSRSPKMLSIHLVSPSITLLLSHSLTHSLIHAPTHSLTHTHDTHIHSLPFSLTALPFSMHIHNEWALACKHLFCVVTPFCQQKATQALNGCSLMCRGVSIRWYRCIVCDHQRSVLCVCVGREVL